MTKSEYQKVIDSYKAKGYIHIDTATPKMDGKYDAVLHCGSMVISFKERKVLFRNHKFPRMDWDYVIMWK